MKCRNCGAEIYDGAKFCTECGHALQRERTILDPLPELDGYRRVRNKILMFDDHSKPLNIYCFVMIALFAVIGLASLILRIPFVSVFAAFLIVVLLLMLWANNRKTKRVRFAVGRPLVVILPLLMIQLIFVTVFIYRTQTSFDDPFFNSDSSVAESAADDNRETLPVDSLVQESEPDDAYMAGTYSRSYEEELDGEITEITETIVLNADHTCEVTLQDSISGHWNGNYLWLDDGQEFEFKVEGDSLFCNMNGESVEFKK